MKLLSSIVIGVICVDLSWSIECPDRWVTFQGSCYLFGHEAPLSFVEAEHFCSQHHDSHLVHVNTALENLFIIDFLKQLKGRNYWMGLTDENIEGIWEWYDTGESVTFTDWKPGEPNDSHGEDCAVFRYEASYSDADEYHWNDDKCNNKYEPICELSNDIIEPIVG